MKIKIGTPKWWLLQTSGRYWEVVVNSGLTVYLTAKLNINNSKIMRYLRKSWAGFTLGTVRYEISTVIRGRIFSHAGGYELVPSWERARTQND